MFIRFHLSIFLIFLFTRDTKVTRILVGFINAKQASERSGWLKLTQLKAKVRTYGMWSIRTLDDTALVNSDLNFSALVNSDPDH